MKETAIKKCKCDKPFYLSDEGAFFCRTKSNITGNLLFSWNLLSNDTIRGTCVISGLFNLLPIKISAINGSLKMDEQMALRNSPVHLLPATTCPLSILVGSDETSEFLAQSNELYTCWKECIPAEIVQAPGLNHYSIFGNNTQSAILPTAGHHRIMKI